jgi:hypothetical protein
LRAPQEQTAADDQRRAGRCEDVGRIASLENWALDLLPDTSGSFYKSLEKARAKAVLTFMDFYKNLTSETRSPATCV